MDALLLHACSQKPFMGTYVEAVNSVRALKSYLFKFILEESLPVLSFLPRSRFSLFFQ
jgi:hypothetical protein